jgi:hypothetical protein
MAFHSSGVNSARSAAGLAGKLLELSGASARQSDTFRHRGATSRQSPPASATPEGKDMQAGKWIIAGTLALGLVPRLAAADYWRYETDSGSTAFTDDAKNIPAKYRDGAVKIAEESLATYRRLSIVEKTPAVAPRPPAYSSMAPEVTAEPSQPGYPRELAEGLPRQRINRLGINVEGIQVDMDTDQDEPITIDKRQYMDGNGDYFDHDGVMAPMTVIRQGGHDLAYIDER